MPCWHSRLGSRCRWSSGQAEDNHWLSNAHHASAVGLRWTCRVGHRGVHHVDTGLGRLCNLTKKSELCTMISYCSSVCFSNFASYSIVERPLFNKRRKKMVFSSVVVSSLFYCFLFVRFFFIVENIWSNHAIDNSQIVFHHFYWFRRTVKGRGNHSSVRILNKQNLRILYHLTLSYSISTEFCASSSTDTGF